MTVTPRKVIVTLGGRANPNQEYERMILYNEDGTDYTPPAGGVGPVVPVPVDTAIADTLGSTWTLISADVATNLTIHGTCRANSNGDLGRLVLLVTGDNGATASELDQFATQSTTDVPVTLKGIIPAGWKAWVNWEQNAPGQGGSYNLGIPIVQPLA
jgi:hypothetical protein